MPCRIFYNPRLKCHFLQAHIDIILEKQTKGRNQAGRVVLRSISSHVRLSSFLNRHSTCARVVNTSCQRTVRTKESHRVQVFYQRRVRGGKRQVVGSLSFFSQAKLARSSDLNESQHRVNNGSQFHVHTFITLYPIVFVVAKAQAFRLSLVGLSQMTWHLRSVPDVKTSLKNSETRPFVSHSSGMSRMLLSL